MHRFWDHVIKHVLIEVKPKTIVEIGSLTGDNTFKILQYCKQFKAHCIVIDPSPQYDVILLKEHYGKEVVSILEKFSLDALSDIDQYDMILIDGDHNWYTVYNELKQVEQMANATGKFPVVLMHDIDWPYGRRDMYYYPESIPEAYRKPSATRGMKPGQSELLPYGGFNNVARNAIYEGGDKNGVHTAIDDFLKETSIPIRYYELLSNNGLGLLIPEDSDFHASISYILDSSGL